MDIESQKLYSFTGTNIKIARNKKQISQAKLAQAVGLTRTSITNIEKGRQKILLDTLWQIASILEVPVMQLLPTPQEMKISLEERLPEYTSTDEKVWIKEVINDEAK